VTGYKVGPAARAIEFTLERSKRLAGDQARVDWDASIGLFFVNGPFHPFWSWWAVACAHLRPIRGGEPPRKHYTEAEYEFAIWSLDTGWESKGVPVPDRFEPERDEDVTRWTRRILQPADVVKQFDLPLTMPEAARDAMARRILEQAVDAIINGHASPDSDYRRWWKRAIDQSIEHELTGGQHSRQGQA
jgi:hypothetical protein